MGAARDVSVDGALLRSASSRAMEQNSDDGAVDINGSERGDPLELGGKLAGGDGGASSRWRPQSQDDGLLQATAPPASFDPSCGDRKYRSS